MLKFLNFLFALILIEAILEQKEKASKLEKQIAEIEASSKKLEEDNENLRKLQKFLESIKKLT